MKCVHWSFTYTYNAMHSCALSSSWGSVVIIVLHFCPRVSPNYFSHACTFHFSIFSTLLLLTCRPLLPLISSFATTSPFLHGNKKLLCSTIATHITFLLLFCYCCPSYIFLSFIFNVRQHRPYHCGLCICFYCHGHPFVFQDHLSPLYSTEPFLFFFVYHWSQLVTCLSSSPCASSILNNIQLLPCFFVFLSLLQSHFLLSVVPTGRQCWSIHQDMVRLTDPSSTVISWSSIIHFRILGGTLGLCHAQNPSTPQTDFFRRFRFVVSR